MITGFAKTKKTVKKRIIASIEGREKCGKTHTALTAPGPLAVMDLDTGLEGVVNKFMDSKDIQYATFDYRDATNVQQWLKMWEKMKAAYTAALASSEIRTLIMDTGTEIWELLRLARFGQLSQVLPHHYGPVNAEFRDLVRKAYDSDKNLLILHKVKPKYVNDKRTDEYERSGFGDIGYLVQMNIQVFRSKDEGFGCKIVDCRQNPELAGEIITEPMNTFPFIASMVFPDTSPDEWE